MLCERAGEGAIDVHCTCGTSFCWNCQEVGRVHFTHAPHVDALVAMTLIICFSFISLITTTRYVWI